MKLQKLVFQKPRDVEIAETRMGDVTVSLHDAKGKYHHLILASETTTYITNLEAATA
jgi:hypothetical protein